MNTMKRSILREEGQMDGRNEGRSEGEALKTDFLDPEEMPEGEESEETAEDLEEKPGEMKI